MQDEIHIALGTAAIGRPVYINIKEDKEPERSFSMDAFRNKGLGVLDAAYEQGIRHFDTAPNYGLAESLLISWIHSKRDASLTVSSKWGYTYVANFDPNATEHEVKEHSLEKLNEQWEVAKGLLPYLKLYQVHSATLESGVLENRKVLDRLYELKKEFGLVIGVTVTGDNQVEVLEKALGVTVNNEYLFQSFQFTFNILDQSVSVLRDRLRERTGPVLLKEVLANGRLIPNVAYGEYRGIYDILLHLANKYGVGVDAIALRFAIDSFKDARVLSGAGNRSHLKSNLKADSFALTGEELESLQSLAISPKAYWKERKALPWN
ncbi:MAG: aldo/keto reductase [Bacteroidota bacterium]